MKTKWGAKKSSNKQPRTEEQEEIEKGEGDREGGESGQARERMGGGAGSDCLSGRRGGWEKEMGLDGLCPMHF